MLCIEVIEIDLAFIEEKHLVLYIIIKRKLVRDSVVEFASDISAKDLLKLDVVDWCFICSGSAGALSDSVNEERIDFSEASFQMFTE